MMLPTRWTGRGRIFVQRSVCSHFIVISGIGFYHRRKCVSPRTTIWFAHSRRIDPINLSAKPFCQGESRRRCSPAPTR
jgi:hypothetical protein